MSEQQPSPVRSGAAGRSARAWRTGDEPGARHEAVQAHDAARGDLRDDEEEEEGPPPAPWHFKVLLVGTVGYLIYRLVWFVFWLTGHAWRG